MLSKVNFFFYFYGHSEEVYDIAISVSFSFFDNAQFVTVGNSGGYSYNPKLKYIDINSKSFKVNKIKSFLIELIPTLKYKEFPPIKVKK